MSANSRKTKALVLLVQLLIMMANCTRRRRYPFEPHKTARRQIPIRRIPSGRHMVIIEPIPTE